MNMRVLVKSIGSAPDNASRLNKEVIGPLKYLSNFWKSLNLLLINSEIELNLSCPKESIISEISRTFQLKKCNRMASTETTRATFEINNAKLYISVCQFVY